jgi:hypothetical protein
MHDSTDKAAPVRVSSQLCRFSLMMLRSKCITYLKDVWPLRRSSGSMHTRSYFDAVLQVLKTYTDFKNGSIAYLKVIYLSTDKL